jgi:hypothetical protein
MAIKARHVAGISIVARVKKEAVERATLIGGTSVEERSLLLSFSRTTEFRST